MSVTSSNTSQAVLPRTTATAKPARRFFSMRTTTSLALTLLVVVAGIAMYRIFGVIRGVPLHDQYVAWSACTMLVFLAIAILLIGRSMTLRSLNIIEQKLQALKNNQELAVLDAPFPDDLGPVMAALSAYVTQVQQKVNQLRLQKKELDIQMRVAEAERQHTEAIIFSISDAVLVIDSFGELMMANTAAERFFNFQSREWQHRPIDRVVNDSSLVALIKDARTTGEHNVRRQVEYSTLRNGKTQTFNITLSTVVDADGQARGVVSVFHDITREREIAQIKTDFVSAVSHELRTPLSSIKAYVEMLVDGEAHDEDTRRNFYEIIQTETDRLQRLISNILNISRIESGVVEIEHQSIQVNDIVQEVLTTMQPQADEKDLLLDCDLDGSVPTLWADRDLLHRAILNVIGNAVKYTNKNGRIRVTTSTDDSIGHAIVSVSDNGVGIRPEDLPRIFDKFYRAPDSSSVAKGTGLGLNLVKHIVETIHGGEISVASEIGVGTTIILKFPVLTH